MGTLIATCPVHGRFDAGGLLFGDGQVSVHGSTTGCLKCGRDAPISEGEYQLRDSLRLPTIYKPTPAQARRLQTVVQWAQAEIDKPDADEEKVVRALEKGIEKDAPQLKTWLDRAGDQFKANPAGWIAVLFALLGFVVSLQPQQGVSADELEQILHRVVRDVQLEQVNPAIEEPMPPSPEHPVQPAVPTVTELPTPKTR